MPKVAECLALLAQRFPKRAVLMAAEEWSQRLREQLNDGVFCPCRRQKSVCVNTCNTTSTILIGNASAAMQRNNNRCPVTAVVTIDSYQAWAKMATDNTNYKSKYNSKPYSNIQSKYHNNTFELTKTKIGSIKTAMWTHLQYWNPRWQILVTKAIVQCIEITTNLESTKLHNPDHPNPATTTAQPPQLETPQQPQAIISQDQLALLYYYFFQKKINFYFQSEPEL